MLRALNSYIPNGILWYTVLSSLGIIYMLQIESMAMNGGQDGCSKYSKHVTEILKTGLTLVSDTFDAGGKKQFF